MSAHPTEPGVYFATYLHAPGTEFRTAVEILRKESGDPVAPFLAGFSESKPWDRFKDWEGPIADPKATKPKKRQAIIDVTYEGLAAALNLPAGIAVKEMQVDFARHALRLFLEGPGLTAAHEMKGFQGELVMEAPVVTNTVKLPDGRHVQFIERVGMGP